MQTVILLKLELYLFWKKILHNLIRCGLPCLVTDFKHIYIYIASINFDYMIILNKKYVSWIFYLVFSLERFLFMNCAVEFLISFVCSWLLIFNLLEPISEEHRPELNILLVLVISRSIWDIIFFTETKILITLNS